MNKLFFIFAGIITTVSLSAATLHVDSNAKTSGDGSQTKPFTTIQAAANIAKPGDIVLVHPGIYPECVKVKNSGKPGKPIVFKSKVKHKALIYGAKVIRNWQIDRPGVYKTAVPEMTGEQEEKTAKWTEFGDSPQKGYWLFINGSPLLRTYDINMLRPGCFFTDLKTKILYWVPEQGENPETELAEFPVRRRLFDVEKVSNITIDGFAFKYNCAWSRNSFGQGDADICGRYAKRLTIINNLFEFGSDSAVNILLSTYCTVKNNTILWSGHLGILFGLFCSHMEISGNTICYCNWRKVNVHWGAGGIKSGRCVATKIKNNIIAWNYASGFWSDVNEAELIIANNLAHDNMGIGLYEEAGCHQTFKDNICWNNADGIRITVSADTLVKDNLLFNNGCGIRLLWAPQYAKQRSAATAKAGIPRDLLHRLGWPEDTIERYEREYYSTDPITHDEYILSSNNVVGNVMYENTKNYSETRNYTKMPKNYSELREMCLHNNFSDYNTFISPKGENIFSPSGAYSTDEWRKCSKRDLFSTFSKKISDVKLPDWMKGKEKYLKMSFTPSATIEALKPGFVASPMTAIARGYLLRSKKITQMTTNDKEIRAYFIDLEGKPALLVWNTLANSRKNLRLKLDKSEVILRNGYLLEKKLKLDDGIIDLPVTEVPVALLGIASAKELSDIMLKPGKSGAKTVDFKCRINNSRGKTVKVSGSFGVPGICTVEPASFEKTIAPGKSITIPVKVSTVTNIIQQKAYPLALSLQLGAEKVKYISPFKFSCSKPVSIRKINGVKLDGNTSEWKVENKIATVGRFEDIIGDIFKGDKTSYRGHKDFKADIYAGWTKDAIWYCVDITDDKVKTGNDALYFNYDSVEVFIDGRSPEGQNNAKISSGCYQIVIPAASTGSHTKRLVISCGKKLSDTECKAFPTVAKRTLKGYSIEGKIPFDPKFFPADAFTTGRIVKMFFQMPDRDIDNIKSAEFIFAWGNEKMIKVRNFENTTNWRNMVLQGKEKNIPGEAQIYIDGRHQNIKLNNASVSGSGVILKSHSKDMFRTAWMRKKVTDWQEMTLSFTPDKGGIITLVLNNFVRRVNGKIPNSWIWLDELTIEGAAEPFTIGSFEDDSLKGWIRRGEKNSVTTDEKSGVFKGKRGLRLFGDSQLAHNIKVKAGQKVTVKVMVKNPVIK